MKLLVGTLIDGRHSGIDAYLLDVLGIARREGVHMDFLTNEIDPELKERLDKQGSMLYQTPSLKAPLAQYRAVRRLLEQGNYDAAYFNVSEPLNCVGALAAHKCGLPVIVHSHNSAVGGGSAPVRALRRLICFFCRPVLNACADTRLACSATAARWLFGRKATEATLIWNPVDAARFAFDPAVRRQVREELVLGDGLVLGHVGNFFYAKNQRFLLDLTARLAADGHPATLLLVGTGPDESALRARAHTLGIDGCVRFLGIRSDVERLLCAMDVFIFPSVNEGLPLALLEAQFSGLPCLFGDGIDPGVRLADTAVPLSLKAPLSTWEERVLAAAAIPRGPAAIPTEKAAPFRPEHREEALKALLFSPTGRL